VTPTRLSPPLSLSLSLSLVIEFFSILPAEAAASQPCL